MKMDDQGLEGKMADDQKDKSLALDGSKIIIEEPLSNIKLLSGDSDMECQLGYDLYIAEIAAQEMIDEKAQVSQQKMVDKNTEISLQEIIEKEDNENDLEFEKYDDEEIAQKDEEVSLPTSRRNVKRRIPMFPLTSDERTREEKDIETGKKPVQKKKIKSKQTKKKYYKKKATAVEDNVLFVKKMLENLNKKPTKKRAKKPQYKTKMPTIQILGDIDLVSKYVNRKMRQMLRYDTFAREIRKLKRKIDNIGKSVEQNLVEVLTAILEKYKDQSQ